MAIVYPILEYPKTGLLVDGYPSHEIVMAGYI
jgi:hypothetical protein